MGRCDDQTHLRGGCVLQEARFQAGEQRSDHLLARKVLGEKAGFHLRITLRTSLDRMRQELCACWSSASWGRRWVRFGACAIGVGCPPWLCRRVRKTRVYWCKNHCKCTKINSRRSQVTIPKKKI